MTYFADIAFASAPRQLYTYSVAGIDSARIKPGMRVWAPFRNYYAIGMVVSVHQKAPDFEVKSIRKIMDEQVLLDADLLKLTHWMHQFYYCSWGEAIQAALPSGLNMVSKQYISIASTRENTFDQKTSQRFSLSQKEHELLDAIAELTSLDQQKLALDELRKQCRAQGRLSMLNRLIKQGVVEIWEQPEVKSKAAKEVWWSWKSEAHRQEAQDLELSDKPFKWQQGLKTLLEVSLPRRHNDIRSADGLSNAVLRSIEEKGFINKQQRNRFELETDRLEFAPNTIKELNQEQEEATGRIIDALKTDKFEQFLLYGITGSGKTEVYIHAIQEALYQNKGAIVLVPEIALTPQTVARFYRIFGEKIAVLHSQLSASERLSAWNALKSGEKTIAIGPRSALFAPIERLGLIIIDEEHDGSYKQIDPAPRYHARETAIMRAHIEKCVVILGSATPSLQTLYRTARKKTQLLRLSQRHANARLPKVELLDLKQYSSAMRGPLAVPAFLAIEKALEKKEQVIILLNRRGFASYLQCTDCGHIPMSPDCSVSLTYHKRKGILLCHYSGYSRRADTMCESCGSSSLEEKGSGTQQAEEQISSLFSGAKIIRFDRDSTTKKGSHARILESFGRGEADILIGTQIVAKGLDFPNVTVVVVLDADTEQAYPSFQSSERLYQLLSQVSGRSGRGEKAGTVFIQTRIPEQPALQHVPSHAHEMFAKEEMAMRKELHYPPFSRLVKFVLKGQDLAMVSSASYALVQSLGAVVPQWMTLGPAPAPVEWMQGHYFWEVSVKIDPDKGAQYIEAMLDEVMSTYEHRHPNHRSVRVNIHVDAID